MNFLSEYHLEELSLTKVLISSEYQENREKGLVIGFIYLWNQDRDIIEDS